MRRDVHAEKDIAIVSQTLTRSALACQTNAGAFSDTRWDFDVVAFGLSSPIPFSLLHSQGLRRASIGFFEGNRHINLMIFATRRRPARHSGLLRAPPSLATIPLRPASRASIEILSEERVKKVTESTAAKATEIKRARSTGATRSTAKVKCRPAATWPASSTGEILPTGRRPKVLSGLPIGAECIVLTSLFWVLQDFMGFVNGFEFFFCFLTLIHVRMIFPGQLAIGLLNFFLRGSP